MSKASGSHNGQVRRRRESERRGDRRRRLKLQTHGQQEADWHSGYRAKPPEYWTTAAAVGDEGGGGAKGGMKKCHPHTRHPLLATPKP
ncbi:unnamed protein product [Closterium sp. NIES-65]|nr:unnamed protein product [Closterium sp. NIES-65]